MSFEFFDQSFAPGVVRVSVARETQPECAEKIELLRLVECCPGNRFKGIERERLIRSFAGARDCNRCLNRLPGGIFVCETVFPNFRRQMFECRTGGKTDKPVFMVEGGPDLIESSGIWVFVKRFEFVSQVCEICGLRIERFRAGNSISGFISGVDDAIERGVEASTSGRKVERTICTDNRIGHWQSASRNELFCFCPIARTVGR